MKLKKSVTLTAIVMSLLIGIGIFTGMYMWLNTNSSDSGITIDSSYANVSNELNNQRDNLDSYFIGIQSDLNKVVEADSIYLAAINGFKGLGKILLSPVKIVDYVLSSFLAILRITQVPQFVKTLLSIGIIGLIVLVVVAIAKGEQNRI